MVDTKGIPVDDEFMEATFAVPTVTVNKFVVSTNPGAFRIAFGEARAYGSNINWRIALSMSPMEAFELREVLNQLLEPFKEEIDRTIADFAAMKAAEDGERK